MKRINNKQRGFTLLELLVVVAIIAIIAGSVISAISGQEERAGQGVALNTMGALENATRQHIVLNKGLPNNLDSLICSEEADGIVDTGDLDTNELFASGTTGGLASGLVGKITLGDMPVEGVAALVDNGITSLIYPNTDDCGADADEESANAIFAIEGFATTLDETDTAPIAYVDDPTDYGQEAGTILAVFGVGNQSTLVTGVNEQNRILGRAPIDGNVEGSGNKYSHFSLVIKIGEGGGTPIILGSAEYEAEEVDIVAVLDSDGDHYEDEVAEFAGLEDE